MRRFAAFSSKRDRCQKRAIGFDQQALARNGRGDFRQRAVLIGKRTGERDVVTGFDHARGVFGVTGKTVEDARHLGRMSAALGRRFEGEGHVGVGIARLDHDGQTELLG